jgi:hypothetical protein
MAVKRRLENLQESLQHHAEFLEHLRSVPDSEALDAICRLRSTPNVASVVSALRNNHPQTRISNLSAARGTLPHVITSIEFELTALHTLAYPALAPFDIKNFVMDDFLGLDSVEWRSSPDPSSIVAQSTRQSDVPFGIDPRLLATEMISPHHGSLVEASRPILRTLSPQQYCDPRLDDLDLAYWTTVPITKEYAASAISIYLETEHTLVGSFDPESFLTDLINHRLEYCSSFLVNAVLSVACVRICVLVDCIF